MAGSIRLFVDVPLHAGIEVALPPAQAHYLGTVMRRSRGELVRLFNGRDGEWQARLGALRRGVAEAVVEHRIRPQVAEPDIWLAFALLKRTATDFLVQKATELGAAALLPLTTERTGAERVKLERLAAIAIEAAEQSERLTVPALHPPQRLPALLAGWPAERRLVAAMERRAAPAVAPVRGRPAGLLVGPEGGFTQVELDALGRCPFVVPASLGPRILRAETAAIVGLALLQAEPICS
jgi:16S rRNA (uracil1498-N3)-methyltransferase